MRFVLVWKCIVTYQKVFRVFSDVLVALFSFDINGKYQNKEKNTKKSEKNQTNQKADIRKKELYLRNKIHFFFMFIEVKTT